MAGFWFFVVPTLLRVPNNSPKVDGFHCPVLPKPVEYFSPPATFGKHPHGRLETSRISHQEDLQVSNLPSKKNVWSVGQWRDEHIVLYLVASKDVFGNKIYIKMVGFIVFNGEIFQDPSLDILSYQKDGKWMNKNTKLAPSILKINLNDLSLSSFFLVFCYHLPPPTVTNQQKSTTLHVPNS